MRTYGANTLPQCVITSTFLNICTRQTYIYKSLAKKNQQQANGNMHFQFNRLCRRLLLKNMQGSNDRTCARMYTHFIEAPNGELCQSVGAIVHIHITPIEYN